MKWALLALCAILLAPLALVDVPPLLDYPNHLARATVLAFGASDPIVSRFYAAHWTIIPNLGIDLVLPPLLHVLPVHLAGRVIVGAIVLLPVLGTIAYSRAVFGVWSFWPFASALMAYNATVLLGFLNFAASVGIALLLAAGWIAWRDDYPRRTIALTAFGAVALFFCHLVGLVFLLALIGGYELEWLWRQRRPAAAIVLRACTMLPVLIPLLALYAITQLAALAPQTDWSSLSDKLWQLLFPFTNYVLPLDIATAGLVLLFLIACVATRRCRIRLCSGFALLLTCTIYLASPYALKDTFFLDSRIAVMLGFLVFGGVLPTRLPRAAALATATTFAVLFGIRMATLAAVWHGHQRDLQQIRDVIATVEPGAHVFTTSVSPDEAPAYWQTVPRGRLLSFGIRLDVHLPALLLIERRAYWPFLFDNPSQQPVETLPPYRELAARNGFVPDHGALAVPGQVELCGYDYVLLMDAGGEPDLAHFAAERLQLLASSDAAALFRVKPTACAS